MTDYNALFEPNMFYHVFNRGNNKENIFREQKNHDYFLSKWDDYLTQYVDVWSYCLLPNHFHFLIQVKKEENLAKLLKPGKTYHEMISNQFKNLFISYSKSFNKVYNRTGSLFQKRFKRSKVDTESYLLTLIHYIHHNPIHHNFTSEFTDWKYSSYVAIIGNELTKIKKEKVLKLFGGHDNFIEFHAHLKEYNKIKHLIIE